MSWKDWLAGCSLALTGGVLAGTLHAALGHPPAEGPAGPSSSTVVLPAPEDNSQLTRTARDTAPVGQQVGGASQPRAARSGGAAHPAGAHPPATPAAPGAAAAKPGKKKPHPGKGNGPAAPPGAAPTPPVPTGTGQPPDPGSSGAPESPTPSPSPTGTDQAQPTDPA